MLLERKERSPTHEDAAVATIKNLKEICKKFWKFYDWVFIFSVFQPNQSTRMPLFHFFDQSDAKQIFPRRTLHEILIFPRFSLKYLGALFTCNTFSHTVLWWLVFPRLLTCYTFSRFALYAFSLALDWLQFFPSVPTVPITRSRAYTCVNMILLQDLIGLQYYALC